MTHHAFVCSAEGCGKVFPSDRFLELHLGECHDPVVEIRKEKGERTVSFLVICYNAVPFRNDNEVYSFLYGVPCHSFHVS